MIGESEADADFVANAPAPLVSADTPATEDTEAPQETVEAQPEPEASKEPEEKAEAPDEPEKPKQTPWFQRRIDDLTRERWDEKRRADALEAQLTALRQSAPASEGDQIEAKPVTPAEIERLATERARQIAAENEFNRACNNTYTAGTKEFPDFEAAIGNFRLLGGLPPALVEAAVEAGDAHKVLYQLGKNPEEAARIIGLPPVRMAAAVAKLAATPAKVPVLSKAPPPPKPISGGGKTDVDPEKMSIDQFMEWDRKNEERRRAR